MKKVFFQVIIGSFLASPLWAQTMDRKQLQARDESRNALIERSVEKSILILDYNSWFETLTVENPAGGTQTSQALYYGFGLGWEKNWYRARWGWGLGLSALGGSAVGGDKAGALSYFKARVPWWALRVSPRLFFRWTPRTDFGFSVATFYKKSQWPVAAGDEAITSGSDMIAGAFVDMRLRFNPKLEMIQSFGSLYRDSSIYWRLGLAYRL